MREIGIKIVSSSYSLVRSTKRHLSSYTLYNSTRRPTAVDVRKGRRQISPNEAYIISRCFDAYKINACQTRRELFSICMTVRCYTYVSDSKKRSIASPWNSFHFPTRRRMFNWYQATTRTTNSRLLPSYTASRDINGHHYEEGTNSSKRHSKVSDIHGRATMYRTQIYSSSPIYGKKTCTSCYTQPGR